MRRFLWALAGAAATIFALAWFAPARDYLYVPNKATPVAERSTSTARRPDTGEGGIYYVDVTSAGRHGPERLLPFLRPDGATLVPAHEVVPPGSSFQAPARGRAKEMARSEDVAAAVALRPAGYPVARGLREELSSRRSRPTRPPRRSSAAVTSSSPREGQANDRTPEQLRRLFEQSAPGADVALRCAATASAARSRCAPSIAPQPDAR